MKLIRTIVKHSKKCRYKGDTNPWSGLITASFNGNFAGNQIHGGNHKWFTVPCNDPNCNALRAIHSKVIKDIADSTFEVKALDYSKNQMYQL